jgi:threonine/homoserine/homoserine lactone efflux protein
METLIAIATVAAIACLGIMSPGPDFVAVTYTAVTGSRRSAAAVATGVVLGNGIWAGAALLGVRALFALFPSLFLLIKTLGALYLLWLGVGLLRSARKPLPESGTQSASGSWVGYFSNGLSTTMANPKAAIYYASALSSAAPANASFMLLLAMLAAVLVVATLWFSVVVMVLSTPKASAAFRRFKVYFETLFGVLLVTFGLRQLLARVN